MLGILKNNFLIDGIRCSIFTNLSLFKAYAKLRPKWASGLVSQKSEITIEGFPRSGNTFAVAAFCYAQKRSVIVARHTHAPAQIDLALKYGIPVILLKRDPMSSISSLLVRERDLPVDLAIKRYMWYYSNVMKYREKVVVVDFSDLISNYASEINKVNVLYGTNFNSYVNNKINDAKVFEIVEKMEEEDAQGPLRETHVSRPSISRKNTVLNIKSILRNRNYSFAMKKCGNLYKSL